jgi:hypothetical protein
MSVHLYGHNPLPTLSKREEEIYDLLDDTFREAAYLRTFLKHLNKDTISVALVRLRNRGLVESMDDEATKDQARPKKLWRRKSDV